MTDIFKNRGKNGQMTMTFNWIYVLIAGGIILLFFVGLVVKQKASSEQKLSYDITRILESIITAATVSEQTKNFIDTSGLVDYTINFDCEIDGGSFKNIFSGYGLDTTSATVETPIEAIFAPKKVSAPEIVVWSLPYELPFKVIDLLMLTSSNTKYYVLADPSSTDSFLTELQNITDDLNFEFVESFDEMEVGSNYHIRIVDFDYLPVFDTITDGGPIPPLLEELSEDQVSAVSFMADGTVNYYYREENDFQIENVWGAIHIFSLDPEERDAAKYGTIFAGGADEYMCNMMKAFKRLEIVSDVYLDKFEQLKEYYTENGVHDLANQDCRIFLEGDNSVENLHAEAKTCVSDVAGYLSAGCTNIEGAAILVKELNENLYNNNCVTLY
jgi:hypothetical protein